MNGLGAAWVDTRDAWFQRAVDRMRPWFTAAGAPLPARLRVSVGWPSSGARSNVLGEAWIPAAAKDSCVQIYLRPNAHESEVDYLSTLLHELVHASGQAGHGRDFARVGAKVGLDGSRGWPYAAASQAKRLELGALAEQLGALPHGELQFTDATRPRKKQTTRMLKVTCPGCGCVIRMAGKWLTDPGLPTCGCGVRMECEHATEG